MKYGKAFRARLVTGGFGPALKLGSRLQNDGTIPMAEHATRHIGLEDEPDRFCSRGVPLVCLVTRSLEQRGPARR
jgi:hypothetical protein